MLLGKVYILKNSELEPVSVRVGISDGRFTEISSDSLKVGDQVIVGETQAESASSGNMRFRMF
jgi:HlyD family secretion protein